MTVKPSFTARLFLGFFGLLVLALGFLGTASTLWFQREGLKDLDQFLESEARSLANRLEGVMEGLTFGGGRHPTDVENVLRADLRSFVDQRGNRAVPYKTTLVVIDHRGRVLAQSNQALDLLVPAPALGPGEVKFTNVRGQGPAYRVVTGSFSLGAGRWGVYRIACLLSSLDIPLVRFLSSLMVVIGGCLVLLTFLGAGLILVTLRPVRTMARAAGQISEQNLAARIPVPEGNDDLSKLAVTLNGLLGRLEADYAFQERLVEELTHQLKTPLTILRGRNELALSDSCTEDDLRELIEDNLSDIDGVVNLLNTLLELARFDSRIDRLKTVPVDLKSLVDRLGEDLDPLWASKDLRFEAKGRVLTIEADPDGLRQILTNLYDNSWKFAPQGTVVGTCWEVLSDGKWVRIEVSNQGPPVPDEDLERIFKRFFQSAQGEVVHRGSGLGLSIVRSLVGLHGGQVRAFNPAGGGVAFEILLPYGSSR